MASNELPINLLISPDDLVLPSIDEPWDWDKILSKLNPEQRLALDEASSVTDDKVTDSTNPNPCQAQLDEASLPNYIWTQDDNRPLDDLQNEFDILNLQIRTAIRGGDMEDSFESSPEHSIDEAIEISKITDSSDESGIDFVAWVKVTPGEDVTIDSPQSSTKRSLSEAIEHKESTGGCGELDADVYISSGPNKSADKAAVDDPQALVNGSISSYSPETSGKRTHATAFQENFDEYRTAQRETEKKRRKRHTKLRLLKCEMSLSAADLRIWWNWSRDKWAGTISQGECTDLDSDIAGKFAHACFGGFGALDTWCVTDLSVVINDDEIARLDWNKEKQIWTYRWGGKGSIDEDVITELISQPKGTLKAHRKDERISLVSKTHR